jgi:hypothetical protein
MLAVPTPVLQKLSAADGGDGAMLEHGARVPVVQHMSMSACVEEEQLPAAQSALALMWL